jgi:hypothetical protein
MFLLALLLGAPAVVAGPDLAKRATAVEAPITAVTVYSDRARIVRTATAPPGKGIVAVRFPDLPGALAMDSLRMSAQDGRVVRIEARPVQRSRRSIDQVDALLTTIEQTEDRVRALQAERGILQAESKVLAQLRPAPLPDPDDRGKEIARLGAEGWVPVLDFIQTRQTSIDTRVAELNTQIREVSETLRAHRKELGEYDLAAFSAKRIELTALVDRTGAQVVLQAEYLVPGAKWTPVYGIERLPKQDRITVRTAGLVTQTTGEDWNDVQVTLSTAIPSTRIGMPSLDTWTLGESRDFVLRPQPKRRENQKRMTPVQSQKPVDKLYSDWSLSQLRSRVSQARRQAPSGQRARSGPDRDGDGIADAYDKCPTNPETYNGTADQDGCPDAAKTVISFEDAKIEGALKKPEAAALMPAQAPPPPAPSRGDAMRVVQSVPGVNAGAGFDDDLKDEESLEELIDSEYDRRPSEASRKEAELARDMEVFYGKRRRIRAVQRRLAGSSVRSGPAPIYRQVGLLDNRVIGRGPVGPPNSPARLAGGLDYRYRAITRMTLPSTPEAQRVPLAVDTYPTTPFYAAAPGISLTAYLKATVKNQGGRPLLGGPVNIFVGTDFVGQGRLETTGAGDTLDLPLGADEDIKIVRRVLPKTKTEGVFSSDDITRYETVIEVGNYKRTPIRIRIAEQVPLAGHDKVKVKLGRLSPKPATGPDAQGLMQFDLALKPGETGTIRFDYTVTRPENWKLRQR